MITGNFSGGLELYGTLDAPEVSMDLPDISHGLYPVLDIFPNPARDVVYIKADGMEGKLTLMVYDITGRLLSSGEVQSGNITLEVDGYPEGIYIIRATDGESFSASARLLVRH